MSENYRNIRLFVILSCLTLCNVGIFSYSFSQSKSSFSAQNDLVDIKQLLVKQFSLEEGLSQSMVTMVFRDESGLMWIGTGGGLHCFDGKHFTVFRHNPNNIQSLPDNIVRNMTYLKHNRYLVTTSSAISIFDKEKETFKTIVKPLQSEPVFLKIVRTEKYLFWTRDHGYFWILNGNPFPLKIKGIPKNLTLVPHTAIEMTDDKVLIIGNDRFIEVDFKNEYEVDASEYFVPGVTQLHVTKKQDGTLFFAHSNAIYQYTGKGEMRKVLSSPVHSVSAFFIDKSGALWLGDAAEKKLFTYHAPNSWNEIRLTIKEGRFTECIKPYIKFISEDAHHCIWLGTDGNGLLLYQPNLFDFKKSTIGFTTSISSTNTYIWAGTWKNGLFRFSHQLENRVKITTGSITEGEHIYHLATDALNRLWIASEQGLTVITEKSKEQFSFPIHSSNIRVWETDHDTMIVSTPGTLYVFYSGKTIRLVKKQTSYFITDLLKISGEYWMSSRNGVFKSKWPIADDTNKIATFATNRILKINGKIWIGRNNGITIFSLQGIPEKQYDYPEYFNDAKVYGILHNPENNEIWFSTEKGISMMQVHTGEFYYFNSEYNLQSPEFYASAFHRTNAGYFLYGGVKGINGFFPTEFEKKSKLKMTYIPFILDFKIREKNRDVKLLKSNWNKVRLNYGNLGLYGTVGTGDYERNSLHEYSFLLQNYDQKWSENNNSGGFSYGKLPSGNYTLLVKYKNAYGNWSNPIKIADIEVYPPFWLTPWFLCLLLLTTIAFITFLVQFINRRKLNRIVTRLERKNEINQERLRIARDLHDEIGTELSHISVLANKKPENEDLKIISEKTKSLIENLKYVIWIADPEYDHLDDLQAVMREYITEFAEKAGWFYHFEKWESKQGFEIDSATKRNFFLIVKECLNNSLKHSGADSIFISWEYVTGELHFSYSDNGSGIYENPGNNKGRGLKNIKKRSEESNAIVSFSNCTEKKGLCIRIVFPETASEQQENHPFGG